MMRPTVWAAQGCIRAHTRYLHHTVLFMGNSGVGKTSIMNAITGEKHAIGHAYLGTVKELLKPYSNVKLDGVDFEISFKDTCGLNGTTTAAVDHNEAFKALIELGAQIKGELSMVVFVRKAGPNDELDFKNLQLVRDQFPKAKKAMIVNHCSAELKQAEDNYHGLYSREGIDGVLALQVFRHDEAQQQHDHIKEKATKFIVGQLQGMHPTKDINWFEHLINMAKAYLKYFPTMNDIKLDDIEIGFLIAGYRKEDAKELANQIYTRIRKMKGFVHGTEGENRRE